MIDDILSKLTPEEITLLLDYFGSPELTQREINKQKILDQIEYAEKLLKTNSREITAKRLMFVWDISRATAYRRISVAMNNISSHEWRKFETELWHSSIKSKLIKK